MNEQEPLKQLPYPVYFVCKDTKGWSDLLNSASPPPVEQLYQRLCSGRECWSVQTYVHLKRRGLDVHLVPEYIPGSICITTYDDIVFKDLAFKSFVVACRHDRPRPELCEQRIVHNHLNVLNSNDHFLQPWPQPNLQPRDRSRGAKIENLVYKGLAYNLAEPFKSPEFLTQLQSLGVNLLISPNEVKPSDWIDYTQADLVLAVRNCTEHDLASKPSNKLINSWLAGCPALLGPEPAYQFLRESELDYIEVRSPAEVISAISRLRDNPELYLAMINNGFQRAKDFTEDSTAIRWRELLAGPIAKDYEQWLRQSPIWKLVGRPVQHVWRRSKHIREYDQFLVKIGTGPRLFPE